MNKIILLPIALAAVLIWTTVYVTTDGFGEGQKQMYDRYMKTKVDLAAHRITVLEFCNMGITYFDVKMVCNEYKDTHGIK